MKAKTTSIIIALIMVVLINLFTKYVPAQEIDYVSDASEWVRTEIAKAMVAGIAQENILHDYNKDITREECSCAVK